MNLTREQWRELQRNVNKGGLQTFKKFAEDMYIDGQRAGFDKARTTGMAQVKEAVLGAIEQTLHQEFGFGKKRYEQFANKFNEIIENNIQADSIVEDKTIDDKQIYRLSDADKTVYIILLCITEYMNKLSKVTGSELFNDPTIFNAIKDSHLALEYLIGSSSLKMDNETIDKIYEDAAKKTLYLKDIGK